MINKQSAKQLFINPKTYRHVRYSKNRKAEFTFSGYIINKDEWCPEGLIIYFKTDGTMEMKVVGYKNEKN